MQTQVDRIQILIKESNTFFKLNLNVASLFNEFKSLLKKVAHFLNLISMQLNFLMNLSLKCYLTLQTSTPQNGQTHSSNSSAKADKLFECV